MKECTAALRTKRIDIANIGIVTSDDVWRVRSFILTGNYEPTVGSVKSRTAR